MPKSKRPTPDLTEEEVPFLPTSQLERFVDELVVTGQCIGYDENDRLCRSLPGGAVIPIDDDPDGQLRRRIDDLAAAHASCAADGLPPPTDYTLELQARMVKGLMTPAEVIEALNKYYRQIQIKH